MTGRPLNVGDRVIFARPQGGNSKGGMLDSGTITKISKDSGVISIRVDNGPKSRYGRRTVATPWHERKFYKLEDQ
ncbi:hypothetical protein SEA_WOFFORD_130 [Streptomyces phage Wofford]|uniref:Uncharacterized protein n=1 Tax=Streptomyces phage Wofford TaxID=2283267 RepID=A0A345M9Y0_9CAUD|nr:hypothetical protein HWB78_gp154 [Streptomyces phage Wollford]AXH67301.1 hypothetical protein SEA_WOFFORD_130 [Streptomyces phage Wollford]